jgi:hypothetical protein
VGQTGIRLLVNAAVTGAIIGKGGQVVKDMKVASFPFHLPIHHHYFLTSSVMVLLID